MKKFKCIKEVVMEDSGAIAFIVGKVYDLEYSHTGGAHGSSELFRHHSLGKSYLKEHFVEVTDTYDTYADYDRAMRGV